MFYELLSVFHDTVIAKLQSLDSNHGKVIKLELKIIDFFVLIISHLLFYHKEAMHNLC